MTEIPKWAQKHVIERHYPFTLHGEIDQERSLFFENTMSPQSLFNTVSKQIRSGLQASFEQRHRYISLVLFIL